MRPEPPRPASHPQRQRALMAGAAALTLPGLALRLSGSHPVEWLAAVLFGVAIVGAAFLLAWAAEAVQLDVSQGLALALLALIAVLPEYAVDFVFTWKAGEDPDEFAPLALANMTGANRLLIGVGWSMVVLLAAWRMRRVASARGYQGKIATDVELDRSHAIEISFLAVATLYSLTLPLKKTLTLADAGVLVVLFGLYVLRISRAPAEEPHLVGPAELVGSLPPARRRTAVVGLFAFAAAVILACAEPFAEALVSTGEELGISTFLLVQWLAPLASEAPELLVAGLFAWRLNTNAALGALVSSKVNQWTLLVGTLPLVFAISAGTTHGLPIDALQREEVFLTAAQSAFAVVVLSNRSLGVREAFMLLGLFVGQFVLGGVLPHDLRAVERIGVGILYLVLAAGMIFRQRAAVPDLVRDGFRTDVYELVGDEAAQAAQDRAVTLDRRAVGRGALGGAALILVVSIAGAIIDRSVDDFDDTGWPVTVFLAILVAYTLAGWWAGRATTAGPLTTGALAGLGVFAVWVPVRVLIWAVRDDSRGLFSGDDAVFSLGGVFANLVFAATLGMVGALVGARRAAREVES